MYQKNRMDENGVPIDADTIPNNEFWDLTSEDIGALSLQKLVYAIIDDRKELSEGGCQKVSIVAHSLGTQEALIGLNNPQAADYVDKLVNLAPCAVPRIDYFPLPSEEEEEEVEEEEDSQLSESIEDLVNKSVKGYKPNPDLARYWMSIIDLFSVSGQYGSIYGPYWTE